MSCRQRWEIFAFAVVTILLLSWVLVIAAVIVPGDETPIPCERNTAADLCDPSYVAPPKSGYLHYNGVLLGLFR